MTAAQPASEVSVIVEHPLVAPNSLEPRGIQAMWRPVEQVLWLHVSSQTPHRARRDIATALGLDIAQVRAKSVGLDAIAYVHVALRDHQEDSINSFLRLVETEPQIVECASITGDHDFILKVYAKTPEDLEHFIMQRLLKSGLVRDTRSNFVLRQTKTRGPLPIL